jgi:hypothetical protein
MTDEHRDPTPSIEDRVAQHGRDLATSRVADAAGVVQPPGRAYRDIVFATRTSEDVSGGERVTLEFMLHATGSDDEVDVIICNIANYAESLGAKPLAASVESHQQAQ